MTREEAIQNIKRMIGFSDTLDESIFTLFPEPAESEDERIRKGILAGMQAIRETKGKYTFGGIPLEDIFAWLEKQGEQKSIPSREMILGIWELGNFWRENPEARDGLTQLQYIQKYWNENSYYQKEQKPIDKVEPKFKVGDTMRTLQEANDGYTDGMPVVVSIDNEYYHCTNELIAIKDQDDYEFPPINIRQKSVRDIVSSKEDERIREELIELVRELSEEPGRGGLTVRKTEMYISYLEKQKYDRMKPIYDARESFESALEKAWNDYHNGYENVDKLEDDYVECAHAKGFREGYLFGIGKQKDNKFAPRVLPCSAAWFEDGEDEQKEQKPITESKRLANEVIEYLIRCGYSPVLKDDSKKEHFRIDIPRHEDDFWDSEEYKHCRSVLGEYYMEGDYGCDTYTLYVWRKEQKPVECIPDSVKFEEGFKTGRELGFREGVASIKPAEWSEEDKRIHKAIVEFFESEPDNTTYSLVPKRDILAYLKKRREQKLTEWNEENDKIIYDAYYWLCEYAGSLIQKNQEKSSMVYKTANRLKSLRPQPKCEWSVEDAEALDMCLDAIPKKWKTKSGILLTKWLKDSIHLQPKQEWSEEDKHRCKDAIYFLETAKKHYADTSEIELTIEWLKSLQPQPKQEWSEDIIRRGIKEVGLTQYQINWLKNNVFPPKSTEYKQCIYGDTPSVER